MGLLHMLMLPALFGIHRRSTPLTLLFSLQILHPDPTTDTTTPHPRTAASTAGPLPISFDI